MEGQREGWMDGWMEGWTDGPYFIGPLWPRPGVQKGKRFFP